MLESGTDPDPLVYEGSISSSVVKGHCNALQVKAQTRGNTLGDFDFALPL